MYFLDAFYATLGLLLVAFYSKKMGKKRKTNEVKNKDMCHWKVSTKN